jgi:HPt (histidine-containing phosphotransfer) domain-containing protein
MPTHAKHTAVDGALEAKAHAATASTSTDVAVSAVYWIQEGLLPSSAEVAHIRAHGGVVQVLDSLDTLVLLSQSNPEAAGLVVMAWSATLIDALRAYRESLQRTSVFAMPMLVVGGEFVEEDAMLWIQTGAVKHVSRTQAAQAVCEIAGILSEGTLSSIGEAVSQVWDIRAQAAMAHMQADREFFAQLLRYFFDELPQHRRALHEAWGGEPDRVKQRCHSLKGLALTLGIERLALVARKGESMGPYLQGTEIVDVVLLQQLDHEIQSTRFDVLRWLVLNSQTRTTVP